MPIKINSVGKICTSQIVADFSAKFTLLVEKNYAVYFKNITIIDSF